MVTARSIKKTFFAKANIIVNECNVLSNCVTGWAICSLSSETLIKFSDPLPATLSCPSSSRTMFLQPYQSIIAYSVHVATYIFKVLNKFNDEIMLNQLTLVTNFHEWLAQVCTRGDNSVPWTRRKKSWRIFLFSSMVELTETSFIVLF